MILTLPLWLTWLRSYNLRKCIEILGNLCFGVKDLITFAGPKISNIWFDLRDDIRIRFQRYFFCAKHPFMGIAMAIFFISFSVEWQIIELGIFFIFCDVQHAFDRVRVPLITRLNLTQSPHTQMNLNSFRVCWAVTKTNLSLPFNIKKGL